MWTLAVVHTHCKRLGHRLHTSLPCSGLLLIKGKEDWFYLPLLSSPWRDQKLEQMPKNNENKNKKSSSVILGRFPSLLSTFSILASFKKTSHLNLGEHNNQASPATMWPSLGWSGRGFLEARRKLPLSCCLFLGCMCRTSWSHSDMHCCRKHKVIWLVFRKGWPALQVCF